MTVYERDPVVVSVDRPNETYVPAINLISPNKSTVTPILTTNRIEPEIVYTDRLASPRALRSSGTHVVGHGPTVVRESVVASPLLNRTYASE